MSSVKLFVHLLGKMVGLGGAIARWEKFYLNPFPSEEQLAALAVVVEVEAERWKCCRLLERG